MPDPQVDEAGFYSARGDDAGAGLCHSKPGADRKRAEPEATTMMEEATLLCNAAALDEEGWALIAPFGEHPKTRYVKKNGAVQREKFHPGAGRAIGGPIAGAGELAFSAHPAGDGRHPGL